MVTTDRVLEIFADARVLQADALEMLAQGKVRNAAEKAWGAAKRATDALVLARTGDEPERTPQTSTELRHLEALDQEVRQARLVARYYIRQGALHGDCFYLGLCEPLADTERRIRETAEYIDDAERLAAGGWLSVYRPWGAEIPSVEVAASVGIHAPLHRLRCWSVYLIAHQLTPGYNPVNIS